MRARSAETLGILVRFLNILVSSFAFLVVALLASIAGYALATPNFSFDNLVTHGLTLIVTYILLLWPYYASRHGLLERSLARADRPIDIDSIRYGIEYPAYMIIIVAAIAFFTFDRFYVKSTYTGQFREIIISFFLGLLPFFIVFIASLRNLVSPDTDKAFQFTERVLYPALCTGIVPFSFGWSIASGNIDLSILVVGSFYVIILIVFAKISPEKELLRVAILIILVLLLFIFWMREEFKVIILGTVILLAMLVSEASKRVYQAKAKDRFYPAYQGPTYYLAGSNWSSIVFLWLLSLVPLLITELPTLPFLIFISVQSLIWFFASEKFKLSKRASLLSLFFGYGLPLVIIVIKTIKLSPTFLPSSVTPGSTLSAFGLIIGLAIYLAGSRYREFLLSGTIVIVESYLSRDHNYYLFFIVLTILMPITTLIGIASKNPSTGTKAAEIVGFGSLVTLILAVRFFFEIRTNGIAKNNGKD